jgi:hypothetical protein
MPATDIWDSIQQKFEFHENSPIRNRRTGLGPMIPTITRKAKFERASRLPLPKFCSKELRCGKQESCEMIFHLAGILVVTAGQELRREQASPGQDLPSRGI